MARRWISDLNATVALSEEMLAALLEEVKRTRSAPLRADGTTGPAPPPDIDDPASSGVADAIHEGDQERGESSGPSRDPSRNNDE